MIPSTSLSWVPGKATMPVLSTSSLMKWISAHRTGVKRFLAMISIGWSNRAFLASGWFPNCSHPFPGYQRSRFPDNNCQRGSRRRWGQTTYSARIRHWDKTPRGRSVPPLHGTKKPRAGTSVGTSQGFSGRNRIHRFPSDIAQGSFHGQSG